VVKLPAARRRPGDVTVRVGDALVPYDATHADGWDFEPPRSARPVPEIRLHGPRCDQVQDGTIPARAVQATVTCQDCGRGAECSP
jgi:hypothetical protein